MSANLQHQPFYTLEEYYAIEKASDRRWEYWNGEIVCMSGGSKEHGAITSNVLELLFDRFRDSKCRVFSEGQAVRANATASGFVYPDVSVACSPAYERHNERGIDLLTNPIIIVEVVSDTSGVRDYNPKRDAYQLIPSLADYLIIESESEHISHYQRKAGEWKKYVYNELTDVIILANYMSLMLGDIYH
ncbi:MAG: Uma2 family endonuclease [Blastocatellia bacterium]|nr:Uma2 family endonuclease [Blastocatellia bacterium]MBO0800608.1 Uma2 family endonuclease [Blastocatellia bacterium]